MVKQLNVLVDPHYLSEETLTLIRPRLDENIQIYIEPETEGKTDFQVMIDGSPSSEELDRYTQLKHIIMPWAGVSPNLREKLVSYPQITLHNSHHNAVTTGEMAIALMMAAARSISPVDRLMHECDWTPRGNSDEINYVLYGRTALILGFGAIGQHVALTCQALGMDVLGIRRDPDKPITAGLNAKVYPPSALHALLPKTDVLIITIPLTHESEGMIGKQEFDLMPNDSLLINVGRGPVIDQHAFYEALTNGKLHAAGIDVWWNYPERGETHQQPSDVPLHELSNLVMSPHRGGAGGTGTAETLRAQEIAKLLNAAARGEAMPNQVDMDLGY
ncbi:MAG: NAD(P)-dependent oxidoreductase [Anaerolineae bacterium]|jgi:phosphoglycerate dehydrogenase-like enzyme|nr:NAD(P)-dependent oxidoreductase [Anaerolineae bacterium]